MGKRNDIGSVTVYFETDADFQLDDVVAALVRALGAHITCHDWYADDRQSTLRTIAFRKRIGKPVSNPQMLLDVTDAAAKEAGPRYGIAVPMEGGGYMIGDITRRRLVLTARCPLQDSERVKAMVEFLRSLNIVENVEVT